MPTREALRRVVRLFLLFALFSFLVFPAAAQQPAQSNAQGATLVQKARAQLNGPRPIDDVTLSGAARRIAGSDDESGSVFVKALASGARRLALNLPSGPRQESPNTSGN